MRLRCCVTIALLLALSPRADAWWEDGHSYIAQNAVQHLPAPLQTFINRFLPTIDSYAREEPPGRHYIDIDVYSEFHAGELPRSLSTLYASYGTSFVNGNGIAPWTIANYRATLTARMAAARDLDDLLAVARTAGEMAHYLGDINQPLHTTQNFNGQQTGNFGIHARYEGTMIDRNFPGLPVTASPQDCIYVSDTVDWVLDSIEDRTWAYVDDIMDADSLAKTFGNTSSSPYYNSLWNSTGTFTSSQFQFATEMVASAWYSAWIDAGSPALSITGDYNNDATVDAADYVAWRKTLSTSIDLPNNVGPGVDANDHTQWRVHFGESIDGGSGAAANSEVPEPSTILLLLTVVVLVLCNRTLCNRLRERESLDG